MPLKGKLQGHTATLTARRTRQVNTPRVCRTFVENFSDIPRAQDNLSKLLTMLSASAVSRHPSNLCKFLVRVSALEAALCGERGEQSLIGYPECESIARSDACRVSRVRQTRGVFTCRIVLDARRALRCDLAPVF